MRLKQLVVGILVASVFLLASCGNRQAGEFATKNVVPYKNKQPRHFLTVHLKRYNHVAVQQSVVVRYETTNAHCYQYSHHAVHPRQKELRYSISTGKKSVKIPVDGLVSGYCQWRPVRASLQLRKAGQSNQFTLVSFQNYSLFNKHYGRSVLNFVCDNKTGNCRPKEPYIIKKASPVRSTSVVVSILF